MYASTLGSVRYSFPDLEAVMAAASRPRSGDRLAGLAAGGMEERVAARYVLADLPLARESMSACDTNHAEADQDDADSILTLLGVAGVTFIMGVPGADDVRPPLR